MESAGRSKLENLRLRISELEIENAALRQKLKFLETHSLLATGIRGESLVARLVGGHTTAYAAAHDVETKNGIRLEVKLSKLTDWDQTSGSKKWQWAKLLGEGGSKKYDFAILIGEADPRYKGFYRNPQAHYVMFCIPHSEILSLSSEGQRPEYRHIQISSNPLRTRREKTIELYRKYQVTELELESRFGL